MRVGRHPPRFAVPLTYRGLFESHAFAERSLLRASQLKDAAKARGLTLSVDREELEQLDREGAVRPVAFRRGIGLSWRLASSPPTDDLVFREEETFRSWDNYAEEVDGFRDVI